MDTWRALQKIARCLSRFGCWDCRTLNKQRTLLYLHKYMEVSNQLLQMPTPIYYILLNLDKHLAIFCKES